MIEEIPEEEELDKIYDWNNIPRGVRVAAEWWVSRADGRINKQKTGSEGFGDVLFLMVSAKMTESNSDDKLRKFYKALVHTIMYMDWWQKHGIFIKTDYGPEYELAKAMEYAGIRTAFPSKTLMYVTKNSTTVAEGYHAEDVILHPTKEMYNPDGERVVYNRHKRDRWFLQCRSHIYCHTEKYGDGVSMCKYVAFHNGDCENHNYTMTTCTCGRETKGLGCKEITEYDDRCCLDQFVFREGEKKELCDDCIAYVEEEEIKI